jgi:hypothetical protein
MGYDASFYELATGGHSYGKNHDDAAAFMSLGHGFLRRAIGWSADKTPRILIRLLPQSRGFRPTGCAGCWAIYKLP